jgi:hypothetical protein
VINTHGRRGRQELQDRIEMGLGMVMVHGGLPSVSLLEVNVMLETFAAAEEDVHLATKHRVSAERGVLIGTLKKGNPFAYCNDMSLFTVKPYRYLRMDCFSNLVFVTFLQNPFVEWNDLKPSCTEYEWFPPILA